MREVVLKPHRLVEAARPFFVSVSILWENSLFEAEVSSVGSLRLSLRLRCVWARSWNGLVWHAALTGALRASRGSGSLRLTLLPLL